MGDTSETNTKVLSRELFLSVVALKRLYQKIVICATRTLFSGTVTYGIGAVLSHIMDNGEERPITYSSRTLNAAEKRYS